MTTNDGGTKKGVFLLGFDDIVYGSEAARESQDASLKKIMGDEMATQFWEVYERSRNRLGGVSVPLILQEFFSDFKLDPPQKREVERVFFDFPFAEYLYHSALEILSFLRTFFQVVLISDGDSRYQPRKIDLSGVPQHVDAVHVWWNKVEYIDTVVNLYPAPHYFILDCKQYVLWDLQKGLRLLGRDVTAILVRQGRLASMQVPNWVPDVEIARIRELPKLLVNRWLPDADVDDS